MHEDALDPLGAVRLYGVARALTGALTAPEVATAVFGAMADLGAASTGLWLVEAGTIRFAGGAGIVEELSPTLTAMPLDSPLPAAEAVTSRRIVTYGSVAERDRRWPLLERVQSSAVGTAVLPLVSSGRVLGCMHIAYPVEMAPADFDLQFLGRLSELCAAALDRAQLHDSERDRQAFLLDASTAVAQAAGFRQALELLASVAVPRLADLCLIDVWERPGRIQRMAAAHADPAVKDLVDELLDRYPPEPGGEHPASQAMAEGRSHWRTDLPEDYLRATTRDERHFELAVRLGFTSFMCVPLLAAGETLGAITLVSAGSGRRFAASDLALAEDLAGRVADVVAAARRHDREHELAHQLQRLLLPAVLPAFDGVEIAARYLTAHGEAEAGGDFYDVVRLPSDRLGFVIGDVEGHDPVAAALMGQLRSAIRALAGQHREPHQLIDALRWSWDLLGFSRMATCLVGRLDPLDGTVVLCSAGHLPPIVVGPDGRASVLSLPGAPPLGAPAGGGASSAEVIPAGSTLFLYTDGLVEGDRRDIDGAIESLRGLLEGAPCPAEELCDRVVRELASGGDRPDDIAMLAIRTSRKDRPDA